MTDDLIEKVAETICAASRRHEPTCEVTIGFEQDPACTCGLDDKLELAAQLAAAEAELHKTMSAVAKLRAEPNSTTIGRLYARGRELEKQLQRVEYLRSLDRAKKAERDRDELRRGIVRNAHRVLGNDAPDGETSEETVDARTARAIEIGEAWYNANAGVTDSARVQCIWSMLVVLRGERP